MAGRIGAGDAPRETIGRRRRGLHLARWFVAALALAAIALSLAMLEREEGRVETRALDVGTTPATLFARPGVTEAPVAVIAHGFAGSQQFMQGFAYTLARAGYVAVTFDFEGHGRNTVPMSGDVTEIDGTTRRLISETDRVIAAARAAPEAGEGLALVGHSMATDVIVRTALQRGDVDALVAVSMYSEAVTATEPDNLLIVTGQWEPALREVAREALREVDSAADEGQTAQGAVTRRAVVAPLAEHVGVLYATETLRETRAWLDRAFDRDSDAPIVRRGPWVALLMGGIVALAWPLFSLLPARSGARVPGWRAVATAGVVPALATPLALWPVETDILPVLVADYLALHLALYGLLQLGVLAALGIRPALRPVWPGLALAAYGIGVFGFALDQYGASFMPHAGRLPVIAAVSLGAVPFMLADAVATAGGAAPLARRLAVRAALFASLALAVALDFEGLFFLILIIPIILLFFLVFGTMGGWVGRRAGPVAMGLGLGLVLGWAIGVSFPLFAA